MEIIRIFAPYLYSIQYDSQEEDEYTRLLYTEWNDVEKLLAFMQENKNVLEENSTWNSIKDPYLATKQVIQEAEELKQRFQELKENTQICKQPDFDNHFKYLNGKYKYLYELIPMKSYGCGRPSLLRIYAIKLDTNKYLITGGGIKLCDTIQESPGIKDHVLQNIDRVRSFLRENDIDEEDL